MRLLADEDVARDIAQESFLRLLSRWPTPASPRAYLFTIATNLIRRRWRRLQSEVSALRTLQASASEPDSAGAQALRDLIERLPTALRRTVVLYYFADMPIADVAKALRVPQGTVKRRLHHARAQLRESWLTSEREPSRIERGDS